MLKNLCFSTKLWKTTRKIAFLAKNLKKSRKRGLRWVKVGSIMSLVEKLKTKTPLKTKFKNL